MKTLTTGDLFGDESKFKELESLVKKIKPNILIITGGIFKYDEHSPLLQSDDLFKCKEYFINISKHCEFLVYIFGPTDLRCLQESFQSLLNSESDNIFCLNDENFNYKEHTFIGLPQISNSKILLKDWNHLDDIALDYLNCTGFYVNEEFELIQIKNLDEMRSFVGSKPSLEDIFLEKSKDSLKYKIAVSSFPPYDANLEEYNYYLNGHLKELDLLYVNKSQTEEYNITKTENYTIIKHGAEKNFLQYNINIIKCGNVIYNYHPANVIKDSYNNGLIYRDMKNAN